MKPTTRLNSNQSLSRGTIVTNDVEALRALVMRVARREKVDFQRNVIYVPNSKTGKDYSVPMNEDVRNTLLQLRNQSNPSEYVFVNPETYKPYTDLKKSFGTACRLAGIRFALARFAPHFRHKARGGWL